MKRLSIIITLIIVLISGCQTFYNWTIRPNLDFYFLHFFNSMFIDEVAKYVTCYYYLENKFPDSHFDIMPLLPDDSINDIKVKDSTFLIRDYNFIGIAKYEFKIKNLKIETFVDDTTDSYLDSIKVYECNGTLTFTDSIYYEAEKTFIVEILISDINGTLYWNGDSSYYDENKSRQILNSSSSNYSVVNDTIQISKTCQKNNGLEINSKQ